MMNERTFRARFGRTLRIARRRRGFTQRELAARADIADRYLSRLEVGIATPSMFVVERLARALGVGLDALMASSRPAEDRRLDAVVSLLRGRSPAEIARAQKTLARLFR